MVWARRKALRLEKKCELLTRPLRLNMDKSGILGPNKGRYGQIRANKGN